MWHSPTRRRAFSLVELLIVVVLLSILAAYIVPSYLTMTDDADLKLATHNLSTFRAMIQLYRGQHGGKPPSASMQELLRATNAAGEFGVGPGYSSGPYLSAIPGNPMTDSSRITSIDTDDPVAAHTSNGGWLYNPDSGRLWLDRADLLHW